MILPPTQGVLKQRPRLGASSRLPEGVAEHEPGGREIGMSAGKLFLQLSEARTHEWFAGCRRAGPPFRGTGVHARHRCRLVVLAQAALDQRECLARKVPGA